MSTDKTHEQIVQACDDHHSYVGTWAVEDDVVGVVDTPTIILDGSFTLDELRAIVAVREKALGNEVTPWFSGNVKPARPGVYQRDYRDGVWYAEWIGYTWLSPARTAKAASKQVTAALDQHGVSWRGLAQDPKGGV